MIRIPKLPHTLTTFFSHRAFSSTTTPLLKQNPPRPKLPDSEIHEVFLCGSGPGGQKINKTHSAVQLKHIPTGVVVKYQDTRSREQNRKIARQLLAARVDELLNGDEARSKVVERELARKRASGVKKSKRKYRALEEEKAAAGKIKEVDDAETDVKMGSALVREAQRSGQQVPVISADAIAGFVINDDAPKSSGKKSIKDG